MVRLAGGGIGVAVALAIEACGSSKSASTLSTTTASTPGPDASILNNALDLEHMAIAAYTAAAPLLPGTAQLAAQRFLAQELAHAGELAGLVKQAGGKPIKPRSSYDLGNPQSTEDVLTLLGRIEEAQLAAYAQAIPLLSLPSSRAAVAAIFANDAQHASVIALALGRNPVPSAFVRPGK
jgi:bacterioferritin (cytochrome b1)